MLLLATIYLNGRHEPEARQIMTDHTVHNIHV